MNPKSEPLPDSTAEEIEYRCFCGFVGNYAHRESHLEFHRREKKKQS